MRPTLPAATVMLLAAFAAVGCSKRGDASKEKAGTSGSAEAKPLAKSAETFPVKPSGEEGFAADTTTTITGPVSFVDGEAAFQAKKYSDATTIFERYVVQRPKNPWGHYMLGLSAWKGGDFAKAEQAFQMALSLDPQHAKSLTNLSRLFIEQKRLDEAVDTLTRAADAEPDSVEVQRLLGRTYREQGKTEEAVAAYRRAIELNELDAWSMNNLGLLLLGTQRAEEALPLFAKAAELKENEPVFQNNLGMALEHTGRFKAAAAAYKGALAADPGYGKAKLNLARVEAVKGGPEEPFEVAKTEKVEKAEVEKPVKGAGEDTAIAGDEQASK